MECRCHYQVGKTLKHYYMFYLIDNPYFRDNRVADNYLQKGGVTYLRNAPKPMFEAIPIVESKWHSSRKERRKNRFNKPMELTSTEFIRMGGAK